MNRNTTKLSSYFHRVKLFARNTKYEKEMFKSVNIVKDYLHDSANISSLLFSDICDKIQNGILVQELKNGGLEVTDRTSLDVALYLVDEKTDQEYLLSDIHEINEVNLEMESKILQEQDHNIFKMLRKGQLPHEPKVEDDFFYRIKKLKKQSNGSFTLFETKDFLPTKDKDYLQFAAEAHNYHYKKVAANTSLKNMVKYDLFIVQVLYGGKERETMRKTNFEMDPSGFFLEKELERKKVFKVMAQQGKELCRMETLIGKPDWDYQNKLEKIIKE